MKHISFLLSILLTIILFSNCEDANITNLKNQVRALNVLCPINVGISGDFLSIKYNEKDKNVYMYFSINEEFGSQFFLKESRGNILSNLKLFFQNPESYQMLKDMVNAKAGLVVIYKIQTNGEIAQFEIPYEDLKEIKEHPISEKERTLMIINNKIAVENNRCPYELEPGVSMVKTALIDDKIVYYIQVDEDLFNFKEFKKAQNEIRENTKQNLGDLKSVQTFQGEIKLLTKGGFGYHYRYFGNKSKDYFDIIFTPEELSKYGR